MNAIKIESHKVDDTAALALALSKLVCVGDCLALSGEVGAGKTTFVQHFLKPLLAQDEIVTSPTFTLVQPYETNQSYRLYHADLYRIKHASEFSELGLEDVFEDNVTLIEWPEIAFPLLPEHTLYITIEHMDEHKRQILLQSHSATWQKRLHELVI